MALKFPLSYYDEAGRLKPPLFLFLGLAFFCRGLIILIIALSLRQQSDQVMEIFYPSKAEFYWSLLPALLAVLVFLIIARRQSLWRNEKFSYFSLVLPLLLLTLCVDVFLQVQILVQNHFQFILDKAITLTFSAVFLVFLLSNKHFKALTKDWCSRS